MRISDWSSDVCSSDLNFRVCGYEPFARRSVVSSRKATCRDAECRNEGQRDRLLFLAGGLAFVGAPVIAQDASGVQSVVSVEGWVPVICQASAPDRHPEEGLSGPVRFVGTLEETIDRGTGRARVRKDV